MLSISQLMLIQYELALSIGQSIDIEIATKKFLTKLCKTFMCQQAHFVLSDKDVLGPTRVGINRFYSYPESEKQYFITHWHEHQSSVNQVQIDKMGQKIYVQRMTTGQRTLVLINRQDFIAANALKALNTVVQNFNYSIDGCIEHSISKILSAQARIREQALIKSKNQAILASKAKDYFLANMNHELRTPLHGILGTLQLLDDCTNVDVYKKEIVTIKSSAESLLSMLSDILNVTSIESGDLVVNLTYFDLKLALAEAIFNHQELAHKKGLDFRIKYSESFPSAIEGDSAKICQIVSTLLSNAVKFTDKGFVRIEINWLGSDQGISTDNSGILEIKINDSGIGISKEHTKSVFKNFTQVDQTASRKYGGTGLGLTISKKLVQLMKGKISVQSQLDCGTTFKVKIPTLARNIASSNSTSKAINPIFKKLNILIAEDNELNQVIMKAFVKKMGHQFSLAKDGNEALQKYQEQDFDLILMDIQMPNLNGYDATKKIRLFEKKNLTRKPIIAITAHALLGDREKCISSGMDDYLSKPVNYLELEKIIKQYSFTTTTSADRSVECRYF